VTLSGKHIVTERIRRRLMRRRLWSRGAISWGADLSSVAPTVLNANGNVGVGSGTWGTVILSQSGGTPVPLVQSTNNDFYPFISGVLALNATAGTLTALEISYAVVSGTPLVTASLDFAQVNNSFTSGLNVYVPFFLSGPLAQAAYKAPGTVPLIELMPTGDQVNMVAAYSYGLFQLVVGVE
jgi:hypothetical protein